jgi:hypothetical protein
MKHFTKFGLTLAFAGFSLAATADITGAQAPALSPGFTENKGQLADQDGRPVSNVLFKLSGGPQGMYITGTGLTHVFTKTAAPSLNDEPAKNRQVQWSKVEMVLEGASIKKENIETSMPREGYSNYYYPHCPQGVLNVMTWHKVVIRSVYPGIDWVLLAGDKGVEHDFIVHPGADASQIRMVYKGAEGLVKQDNRLQVKTAYGTLIEGELKSWTEKSMQHVESSFKIKGNKVSFALGKYNKSEAVVIDPPLQWFAPQTSTGMDYAYDASSPRDASGDVCVTGFTDASDYPTLNAYQGSLAANEDMVIFRLDGSGTMIWSTYYGGSDYEAGKGIGTDNSGNCYVTGYTGSANLPVSNTTIYGGGVYDVAILKFDNTGARQWATFYGGLSTDYATALDSDNNGNIYITGYTNSAGFPTLNAIQATKNTSYDAFIIKMDNAGTTQWATFYGGDDEDRARAIKLDQTGTYVHIAGTTLSGGFPTTAGAYQTTNSNAYFAEEGFVAKFDASSAVQFTSFLGATDSDFPQGIAVDPAGNIYVTGYTFSSAWPIVNPGGGAYVDSSQGSIGTHDAFVSQFNSSGSNLLWSTYLGGSAVDMGMSIAADSAGIFIGGLTGSTDFPLMQPADNMFYQSQHGDAGSFNDMFIVWFYLDRNMQWSTFYGDTDNEEIYAITADASGNIFAAGIDNNDIQVLKFNPGIITGMESIIAENDLHIYPSAASDVLNIELASSSTMTLTAEIMSITGQLISRHEMQAAAGSNKFTADVSALAQGTYLLRLTCNDNILTRKFIKK